MPHLHGINQTTIHSKYSILLFFHFQPARPLPSPRDRQPGLPRLQQRGGRLSGPGGRIGQVQVLRGRQPWGQAGEVVVRRRGAPQGEDRGGDDPGGDRQESEREGGGVRGRERHREDQGRDQARRLM